jgi:CheY-like chemotaxis protein
MSTYSALIVEDDIQQSKIFALTLQMLNLEVTCIADGREALAYLQDHTPDLIVLDLNLPSLNGADILYAIRQNVRLMKLPVILATADDHLGEIMRSEADLVLLKPISPAQLKTLANRLLFD